MSKIASFSVDLRKLWVSASPGEISTSPENVFSCPVYPPLRRGCGNPLLGENQCGLLYRYRCGKCWWQHSPWSVSAIASSSCSTQSSATPTLLALAGKKFLGEYCILFFYGPSWHFFCALSKIFTAFLVDLCLSQTQPDRFQCKAWAKWCWVQRSTLAPNKVHTTLLGHHLPLI